MNSLDCGNLTVILPIWNEAGTVPHVLVELLAVPGLVGAQVLAVDDGSTDGSARELDSWAARDARVRVVHLPHGNKDAALWHAVGDADTEWLCAMDADGQYDPSDIVRLMDHAGTTGADAVWGVRVAREDHALRFVSSAVGRMARRLVLGTLAVHDAGCGLVLVRRTFYARATVACPRPAGLVHCQLAELIHAMGGKVAELPIAHRPRRGGRAKFGALNRMVPGVRSLLQARKARRDLGNCRFMIADC